MSRIKPRLIIFLLALSLVPYAGTNGQTRKKTPRPAPPNFSTSAFDLVGDTIPLDYLGNDLIGVFTSLVFAKINLDLHSAKDQFETTAEYKGRMEQYETFAILKTLRSTDT